MDPLLQKLDNDDPSLEKILNKHAGISFNELEVKVEDWTTAKIHNAWKPDPICSSMIRELSKLLNNKLQLPSDPKKHKLRLENLQIEMNKKGTWNDPILIFNVNSVDWLKPERNRSNFPSDFFVFDGCHRIAVLMNMNISNATHQVGVVTEIQK